MNLPAAGRVPVDPLLEALEREHGGEHADIVASIRAAQDEVISRPADELLLLQGSAGTGTMVVGARRVSWLLHADPGRFSDNGILVVGPTPSFVRQLSSVVPATGDDVAVRVPLSALGPRVRVGRAEPPEASRLKGDLRLLQVIQRGLRHRQRITAGPVELNLDGRRVRLDGERIAARARELADRPHNEAHRELRSFLLAEVVDRLGERFGEAAAEPPAVPTRSASVHAIDDYLDRAWPHLTPQSFLIGLLANPRQLAAAAGGSLSDHEVRLLTIPPDTRVISWQWSIDDVALLDAADELLNGPPATYEHIVVHEAQDLSPLQLESIRRRSRTGGMTVLGDLAQGTGGWAHRSWDDVVGVLGRDGVPVMTAELRLAYRLPAEAAEIAAGLLPVVAPGARPPRALRPSGHAVELVRPTGEGLAETLATTVRSLVGAGSIAVVVPDTERHAVTDALDDAGVGWSPEVAHAGGPVVVSSPTGCRGLEFDCAVVVEPAEILREGLHGARALYVALTRCTDRLVIVHDRPLPDAIDRPTNDRARATEREPVRAGGPPGPAAATDRRPVAAAGGDEPTAAVPEVAAGEAVRAEDGAPRGETRDDRRTDDARYDHAAGGGRHGDGIPSVDRYAD
ncbi:MAG: HelD family protein, partial [Acidimicrobiia bacterium]